MTMPDQSKKNKPRATVRLMESIANVPTPEMVVVPAGEFIMGTSDEQVMRLYWKEDWAREWHEDGMFSTEQPQHWVDLPAFEIGKYPVTNEEYYVFIYQSNYKLPKGWIGFRYAEGTQHHPVVGVSLFDAMAYCNWLSKMIKKEYRLPTEAEWEKASRGLDGRIYPWGEEFDPWRCNTQESGLEGTSSVDVYVPAGVSPMGVVDTCGNVWEWTSSPLIPYPYDSEPPPAPKGEKYRNIVRGGAWNFTRKLARCASREGNIVDYTSPALGFRIAHSLE